MSSAFAGEPFAIASWAILSNLFSSSLGFGGRRGKPRVVGIVAPLSISALNGQPSKSTADTMNTAAVAKLTLTSSPQESLRCGRDGFMKEVDEAIQKYQKRCSKPSWLPLSASPPSTIALKLLLHLRFSAGSRVCGDRCDSRRVTRVAPIAPNDDDAPNTVS